MLFSGQLKSHIADFRYLPIRVDPSANCYRNSIGRRELHKSAKLSIHMSSHIADKHNRRKSIYFGNSFLLKIQFLLLVLLPLPLPRSSQFAYQSGLTFAWEEYLLVQGRGRQLDI